MRWRPSSTTSSSASTACSDGVERWVAAKGRAHFANGVPVRMTGTARDITERKRWEEHIQLLMREVTHRSKNLLAVIQAMARQTKLASRDVDDFEVRFSGRLQALAASHDLLVQRDWHGVSISELVKSQLGHYLDQHASQIEIEGQRLDRDAGGGAKHRSRRARALHQRRQVRRAVGARRPRRGALERGPATGGDDARLRMSWTEKGGPEVRLPSHKGFGQVVTEQLTARALQGKAHLMFERGGRLLDPRHPSDPYPRAVENRCSLVTLIAPNAPGTSQ